MSVPIRLLYDVARAPDHWVLLDDEPMPETPLSDAINTLFMLILQAAMARQGRSAQVGRHIAVRWDPAHPRLGVDPDVYLVEPPPPPGTRSLLLWKKGHHAPRLALEVVSKGRAKKDYIESPEKCAAAGVYELIVFDPLLVGTGLLGGPHLLQLWRRDARGRFRRVHAGSGPAFTRSLRAWLVPTDEGQRLRVCEDAKGQRPWLTEAEEERAAKEAERAAKEAERAAREHERAARIRAEARVRELEDALRCARRPTRR